jgi:para-aminobenzoate synthetase component 2
MDRMPRILVVDNYDSFVYNLVQYLQQLQAETTVLRNDEVTPDDVTSYDGVLLSPGPGTPEEAGACVEIIQEKGGQVPIFGVCLGLQAIGRRSPRPGITRSRSPRTPCPTYCR